MQKFTIKVCELSQKSVVIEADNYLDAIKEAERQYNTRDIILDAEDSQNVTFA